MPNSPRVETIRQDYGTKIDCGGKMKLSELPIPWLKEQFNRTGTLWIKGANASAEEFRALMGHFIARFAENIKQNARNDHEIKGVTTVALGDFPIFFHVEGGEQPFRGDIISFWCESPARVGGETRVCDGIQLFRELSADCKTFLLNNKIAHRPGFNLGASMKLKELQYYLGRMGVLEVFGIEQGPQVTLESLTAELQALVPDLTFKIVDGAAQARWVVCPVFRPKHSQELCLASSIMPTQYGDYMPMMANGEPIPKEIVTEVCETADRVAVDLAWAAGDLAIVDNTRCLHGRRAQDDARKVWVSMGWDHQPRNERRFY